MEANDGVEESFGDLHGRVGVAERNKNVHAWRNDPPRSE
jgi:hypothetical protein